MIEVTLPAHLKTLASIAGDVYLDVAGPVTQRTIIDALEAQYPPLRGTIRDHATKRRRPFIRFFACGEDVSNEDMDAILPPKIAAGDEPFMVVAAIAGGRFRFGQDIKQTHANMATRPGMQYPAMPSEFAVFHHFA